MISIFLTLLYVSFPHFPGGAANNHIVPSRSPSELHLSSLFSIYPLSPYLSDHFPYPIIDFPDPAITQYCQTITLSALLPWQQVSWHTPVICRSNKPSEMEEWGGVGGGGATPPDSDPGQSVLQGSLKSPRKELSRNLSPAKYGAAREQQMLSTRRKWK